MSWGRISGRGARLLLSIGLAAISIIVTVAPVRAEHPSGTIVSVSGAGSGTPLCEPGDDTCFPQVLHWNVELEQWHLADWGLGIGTVRMDFVVKGQGRRYSTSCVLPVAFNIRTLATSPRSVAFSCIAQSYAEQWTVFGWQPMMFGLPAFHLVEVIIGEGVNGEPGELTSLAYSPANIKPVVIVTT